MSCLKYRHGIGRGGGLESNGKKDHFTLWVLPRYLERVHWRIHGADIATACFRCKQVTVAAGYPQHVAKGTENDIGTRSKTDRAIDNLQRCYAHRAPGAMQQFDLGGQELLQTIFRNRMGLAAANFHQRPGTGGYTRDFSGDLFNFPGLPVFVQKFHDWRKSSRSPSSDRY